MAEPMSARTIAARVTLLIVLSSMITWKNSCDAHTFLFMDVKEAKRLLGKFTFIIQVYSP